MSTQDLCLLPISALASLIRERRLSSQELTTAFLSRIERLDSHLHSYVTVTAERALAEARRADEEMANGLDRGLLHGIPLALKDLIDTAGVRTTGGSRLLRDRVPTLDATVTTRLREAGAVLLGKQTLGEFAIGAPHPDDFFPPARNPWGLDRIPGGSSSGTGAAVAAGLCAGGLGTDTGGSIRNPAGYSGIVGLKPTYGLVSRRGVIPLAWTLDHVGPLARTVADAALLLQAIVGHDPADPTSANTAPSPAFLSTLNESIKGIRIGVPRSFMESVEALVPEVLHTFDTALQVLRDLGAETCDVTLPLVEHAPTIQSTIMIAEAVAYHEPFLRTHRDHFGHGFQSAVLPGLFYTAADYIQAQRGRAVICRSIEDILERVDLIAIPTTVRTAPTFAEYEAMPANLRGLFTCTFNLTGQPSISIPCGFDSLGLPVGLLLSGRAFDEATILRAAQAYERATEWHTRHPPDATDAA